MSALTRQVGVQVRLHFRNRMALIYSYVFPTIFLVAFWALYRYEAVPLVRHMGELLTVTALGGACFGLPTSLVSERERGVWRRYRLAPVRVGTLVVGTLAARYVLLLTAGALQVGLAVGVFGMPWPERPVELVVAFTLVSFAFLGLGLVIAALANDVPAVQALGQSIFLPMLVIGGVAVRIESLPVWAQHLSAYFPGRYAVEALQVTVAGEGLAGSGYAVVALVVIGAAAFVAGAKLFRWDGEQRFGRLPGRGWVGAALAGWVLVGAVAQATGQVGVPVGTGSVPVSALFGGEAGGGAGEDGAGGTGEAGEATADAPAASPGAAAPDGAVAAPGPGAGEVSPGPSPSAPASGAGDGPDATAAGEGDAVAGGDTGGDALPAPGAPPGGGVAPPEDLAVAGPAGATGGDVAGESPGAPAGGAPGGEGSPVAAGGAAPAAQEEADVGPPDPARPGAEPWRAVTMEEIVALDYAALPPDDDVVSPVARLYEDVPLDILPRLQCIRSMLGEWPPGKVEDPVQRVRNYLYVAAVPDLYQMGDLERWIPVVIFQHLMVEWDHEELMRVLYWIVTHPEEGDDTAATQLRGVCLDLSPPGDALALRERVYFYGMKLLGRIAGILEYE